MLKSPKLEDTKEACIYHSLHADDPTGSSDGGGDLSSSFGLKRRSPSGARLAHELVVLVIALQFSYVDEVADSVLGPRNLSLFSNVR